MKALFGIGMFVGLAGLTSCERGCLCHLGGSEGKAFMIVDVDWSECAGTPTGMTVISSDGASVTTHDINSATLRLSVGNHDLVVFNQSESEFEGIAFAGFTAKCVTAEPPSWLTTGLTVIEEPEWLSAGTLTDLTIWPEMVGDNCKCELCECCSMHAGPVLAGTVTPRQLTYHLNLKVYAEGLKNVRSVRAAFNGLASEFSMLDGSYEGYCSQLLPEWMFSSEHLSTSIHCFGLAEGIQSLTIQFLLVDGSTIISDTLEANPIVDGNTINVELTLKEPIPDVEIGGNGGFDVTIDDWDDPDDIDIKM